METEMFYKCKSDEYNSFVKGHIYSSNVIGKYLDEFPDDWSQTLSYPTCKELLDCIENGTNTSKVIRALKQWKHQK